MKRLKQAFSRNPVLTSGFVLALLFMAMFAVRGVVFAIYWSNGAHHDAVLQDWMTPRYVARSWHLPPKVVLDALQLDDMPGRRQSIGQIAQEHGITIEQTMQRLNEAATQYRANQE